MTLKQETASVLAKFTDKSNERKLVLTIIDQYKLDSPVIWPDYDKTINNPVMIGTVLKYMSLEKIPRGTLVDRSEVLFRLYLECGIDKSLNEIFGGEVWDHYEVLDDDRTIIGIKGHLKDPNAQALLEFIKTL